MPDGTLGGFLADLMSKVESGAPSDACVLCGSTTRLLHPVGRAWACSRCHTPPLTRPPEPVGDRIEAIKRHYLGEPPTG